MKKLTQLGDEIGDSFYVAILTLYLMLRYLCHRYERKECVNMLKELWRTNENGKIETEL